MVMLDPNPASILVIYVVVIIPLGLFSLHDVIDNRFRSVQRTRRFIVFYTLVRVNYSYP